nr:hypothetical protein [Deltaproteobacteria bacterium]
FWPAKGGLPISSSGPPKAGYPSALLARQRRVTHQLFWPAKGGTFYNLIILLSAETNRSWNDCEDRSHDGVLPPFVKDGRGVDF